MIEHLLWAKRSGDRASINCLKLQNWDEAEPVFNLYVILMLVLPCSAPILFPNKSLF